MAAKSHLRLTYETAETIALQGLGFLAGDATRLARFLSLTGVGPQDLKSWADKPHLQAAVLEHLLADESLLLVFASETGGNPHEVAPAYALLRGAADAEEG